MARFRDQLCVSACWFAALVASSSAIASTDAAALQIRSFDLPAQDATRSIPEFARQAGIQIFVPTERLRGVMLPGIRGNYDIREALQALLAGSGFEIASDDGATIVLRSAAPERRAEPAQHSSSSPQEARAQSMPEPPPPGPVEIGEIVVTGTRVVRDGYEAPTPVTVVAVEALQSQAGPDVADYMNSLPAFAGSQTNILNVGSNSGTSGISALSLRDLGPTRTLVLLDGQRAVGGQLTGAVDINTIPQQLIARVDVVTGGASAAYGSDALAGVVNFILDKTFTGIKGEVSGGVTGYGDARNWKVDLSAGTGFADDKGHFLFSGELEHQDPANGASRKWDNDNIGILNNPNYTPTNGQPEMLVEDPVNRSNLAPGGLITSGPLKGIAFGAGGIPYQFNYGVLNDGTSMYGSTMAASLDYHLNQQLGLNETHQNIFIRASYEIADNLNVYFQSSYAHTLSDAAVLGPLFAGNLTIQGDNAFIPASVAAQVAALGVTSFAFGTANADLDGRSPVLFNTRQTNRDAIGADGKFDAFGTTWIWNAYAGSGITRQASHDTRDVFLPNYDLAIDAVRNLTTGVIVCRSTLTNPNNGCVPYDVFGTGVNSQAAIKYITGDDYRDEHYVQNVESVGLRGEPFSVWAGPVSLATGVEHRSEEVAGFSAQPTGYLNGNFEPNLGHYTVTEGYVETVVPLAKNATWAKSLDFNAAVRATGYSVSGYVTTWKAGATYAPIDDLRFRLTRSRDIRAPNLQELFGGVSSSFQSNTQDPFHNNALVTADVLTGGSTALVPEKADTNGFGVVLQPRFIPGFSASVDYWNIDVKDIISTYSGPLALCYQGYQRFCSDFQRVTQDGVALVVEEVQPVNLAREVVEGIDFDVTYRFALADVVSTWNGRMTFHLLATNNLREYSNPVLTPPTDAVGQNEGSSQDGGLPSWRWNAVISYDNRPVNITFTARGLSGGTISSTYIACTVSCPTSTINNPTINENWIPGAAYFDGSIAYTFHDGITAFLNVQNLAGTSPVLVPHTGINAVTYAQTNLGLYDALGRVFRAGVRFKMSWVNPDSR